ncbi:MAG: hypothetical protein EPO61_07440 [Nitrospirae bacterium]|nr:MAG: hypothetical protein EPO61_07440 [Nitrospirota bacterium]
MYSVGVVPGRGRNPLFPLWIERAVEGGSSGVCTRLEGACWMRILLPAVLSVLLLAQASCATHSGPPASSVPGAAGKSQSGAAPSATAQAAAGAKFPSSLVLSVLYFEDRTKVPDLAWLSKGMVDMLVAEFARNPSLVVVQRERLEEVFREQAFQLSGRVADESTVRVGRMTGATVLVSGSVSHVDGQVRIDAQLMGVEQGIILGTASAQGPASDVSSTARTLVAKVVELIPAGGHRAVAEGEGQNLVQAAKANDAGELHSREGKLFQALEEFERAVAADPSNPSARANYAKTVKSLSGADLLRTSQADGAVGGDRRMVSRLVERLTGSGLDAEVGAVRSELAPDGSVLLRVPVRFRLAASAVDALVESTQALGGIIQRKPGGPAGRSEGAGMDVLLSSRPDLNREFTKQLGSPRRIYLRLLSSEGRTIAIYSNWRAWQLGTWVSPLDEQRVRIASELVLASEARFMGLTPEQVAGVRGAKVTVDAVPHERMTLRLEVSDPDEGKPEPGRNRPRPGLPVTEPEGAGIQALRTELEQAWSPPITERGWGRGYLPGNERTAVVTAMMDRESPGLLEGLRLAKLSGDVEFDQVAVSSVRQAVQLWAATRPDDGAGRSKDGSVQANQSQVPEIKGARESHLLKLRIQFRLIKDVPALNLIGAVGVSEQQGGTRPFPAAAQSPQ